MKNRDYKSGDQISRKMAWEDLKHNLTERAETWQKRPTHMWTAVCVDVVRIAGISDRDLSQTVGRVVAVVVPLFAINPWGILI